MDFLRKPSFANLNLQICLHYLGLYSVMYFLVIGAVILHKIAHYQYTLSLQKHILPPVFVIWALGEATRYFYGFNGNLREKVPDLLTYLLVTVFPQLPLMIYLSFFQEILFPIDILMGCIMLTALVVQILLGYSTLQVLITNQTAQFLRLCDNPE